MTKEIIDFRKQKILRLISEEDSRIKIQFGLKRAKVIKEHIKDIEEFITDIELTNLEKVTQEASEG